VLFVKINIRLDTFDFRKFKNRIKHHNTITKNG
jgi:stalled ribosome rescue protein Dom34